MTKVAEREQRIFQAAAALCADPTICGPICDPCIAEARAARLVKGKQ